MARRWNFTDQLRPRWTCHVLVPPSERQLDGNTKGLDVHTLRHSFNQALKTRPEVLKDVRLDLLGHAGEYLNEEVYGDVNGMPFDLKKAAIDLLPGCSDSVQTLALGRRTDDRFEFEWAVGNAST